MNKFQSVLIAAAFGSVPLTAMADGITDATTVNNVNLSGIGDGCYGDGDLITLGCTKVNGYARENHNPSASVDQVLVNGLNTSGSDATGVGNTSGVTTITGSSTTISSPTTITGATTLNGATLVNNSLRTNNASGANLSVNNAANQASLTASGGQGITINGTTSTQIKGGTHSGILTLQDGDTTGGTVPAGTSLTISGSDAGSPTSTVLQTTTAADGTNVQTRIGTSATDRTSTATLQAGNNGVSVNSGDYTGSTAAAVTINGTVTNSTSTTGVLITGSGQNAKGYTNADRAAGTIPTWADVAIQSKSYGQGDPTLGSAILVTDYGVQILSPQPIAGQQITNNTGVNNSSGTIVNNNGSNTSDGSVINNNGMNSGSGSVVNNTGGTSGSGSATNNIGMNTSDSYGKATNNIGGISGNGTVNNGFGNNTSNDKGEANNSIGMNSGNGTTNNSFGGGSGSGPTNNTIGQNAGIGTMTNGIGNNTSSGSTTNTIGVNSGPGSVTNGFGDNTGSGNATNTFGQNNGSGSVTNGLGGGSGASTNNIGVGDGLATNNIGTGPGISTNTIGSTTLGSSVTTQAGNTQSYMANGVSTTSVAAGGGLGGSVLPGGTTTNGNSAIVLKGATATHVVVDANGKLSMSNGPVDQTSASMTISNGYGNVHGLVVNEQQATLSGGTRSTSLTLNDNGAFFSNSATGKPVRVTGVQDGTSSFDAVNFRQLRQVYAGVAGTAAMANIPQVDQNKTFSVGVGLGNFQGMTAVAVGASYRMAPDAVLKASVSSVNGDGNNVVAAVGAGFSW
ncbi:beta strand repeat-containing protein [Rhodocyclus purpureus]|uniref:beta strand repeat-containing protein n=1 Tax=Rhodocyclus purpureus TaxID=1067 RepID=UPI001914C463|nr:YadA-like family protein [Rhodocyclus purpureus]MBK5915450.1 hypothetical protein [Rhodocyclus purpureus]